MDATKANYLLSDRIIDLLHDAGCTVQEALEILEFTSREIRATAPVQSAHRWIK